MIPELEPSCGSWIVVKNGKPICETFERSSAEEYDRFGYQVYTTLQWLQHYNRSIRECTK